jgi:diguanylate cyclase (GGDEF)-like protein
VLAKAEAEERAQEAQALRMAGAIVASTLEVAKTVELVLDQALNVVPYDTATVQLLREDALEVIGGTGWDDLNAIRGLRIPYPGENPHTGAIRQSKPVSIPDLRTEYPRFSNISGQEIRSWLGVPLVVHGETIGLLVFDSATPDFFTQKHLRLAAAFGDHVAVALFNARLYEQARELAMTDSLTGIATRRSFFADGERLLERARRSRAPLSVLMADLDLLKEINDKYGHARGDDAIRLTANAARDVLRRSDIIGRYGGEEFAVILPDTGADQAMVIAERLRSAVGDAEVPGTGRKLSVSIGVNTIDTATTETIDEILDEADMALLAAKRGGRNRVEVYVEPDA